MIGTICRCIETGCEAGHLPSCCFYRPPQEEVPPPLAVGWLLRAQVDGRTVEQLFTGDRAMQRAGAFMEELSPIEAQVLEVRVMPA